MTPSLPLWMGFEVVPRLAAMNVRSGVLNVRVIRMNVNKGIRERRKRFNLSGPRWEA